MQRATCPHQHAAGSCATGVVFSAHSAARAAPRLSLLSFSSRLCFAAAGSTTGRARVSAPRDASAHTYNAATSGRTRLTGHIVLVAAVLHAVKPARQMPDTSLTHVPWASRRRPITLPVAGLGAHARPGTLGPSNTTAAPTCACANRNAERAFKRGPTASHRFRARRRTASRHRQNRNCRQGPWGAKRRRGQQPRCINHARATGKSVRASLRLGVQRLAARRLGEQQVGVERLLFAAPCQRKTRNHLA